MSARRKTIPVTVDKSHLIAIGEQLYSRSIELIREFINNSYDADATEVRVSVDKDQIVVWDNGNGMDLDGLIQYFNIGSPEKRIRKHSPRFDRELIGQFGIGKFAALTTGERFEVSTQKGDFAASVIFDKKSWEAKPGKWTLPISVHESDPSRGDGTTVTISKLKKTFTAEDLERLVTESVPIRAPHFKVVLNGKEVRPREFSGHRIPFMEGTDFGLIHGEIYILPESRSSAREMGIQVRVKGVLVRREMFGMETWGGDAARVRGEINADFLTITSDRGGFIVDSPEYAVFRETALGVMEEVRRALRTLSSRREKSRYRRALKEALIRIQEALARNPEISPFGPIPFGEERDGTGEAAVTEKEVMETGEPSVEEVTGGGQEIEGKEKEPGEKKPTVRRLTPRAVIQRIKLGQMGITCCLDHFGADGPECFTENNVVYINQDHPLYHREMRKRDTHVMHIARLLTQEIAIIGQPADPRRAYDLQSRLLKDAFLKDSENPDGRSNSGLPG
ncbi:MAG: ATP-binding protein [Deltaproteobacteria bacterium]|nr:ATP-binding protein [Deltaproteobacteria bacterium]